MSRKLIAAIALGLVAAVALVVVVVAVVASDDPGAQASGDPMADFRECLADNGVELPEPPADAGDPEEGPMVAPAPPGAGEGGLFVQPGGSKETESAFEACAEVLPQAPEGAPMPGFNPVPQG